MKRALMFFICAMMSQIIMAQAVSQSANLDEMFADYVKSVDEFMQRFNCKELHPSVNREDKDYKKKNLMWLMNFQMPPADKAKLMPTIESLIQSALDNNVQLSYNDSTWFAKVTIKVKYKNKDFPLTMFLRTEPTPKSYYCWKICGINGIDKIGAYDEKRQSFISNVEHEVNFAEFITVFNNDKDNVFSYKSTRNHIDQLSVFMAFVQTGTIKYVMVEDMEFVFTQVPGFVFTIKEYGRDGQNAGWLISSLKECHNKDEHINKLLNNR